MCTSAERLNIDKPLNKKLNSTELLTISMLKKITILGLPLLKAYSSNIGLKPSLKNEKKSEGNFVKDPGVSFSLPEEEE